MAWVGSNSSRPPVAQDNKCDNCKTPTGRVIPVLVESDSFGAEYAHLCEKCRNEAKAERNKLPCERCKKVHQDGLLPFRDVLDGGMDAPTSYYCPPCHKWANDSVEKEIARDRAYYGDDAPYSYDYPDEEVM